MTTRFCHGILLSIVFILLAHSIACSRAMAKESALKLDTTIPQKIHLTAGKSLVIESPRPVKRVSLAAPTFADAIVLTPSQIYLTGKAPGMTNLTLWEGDAILAAYDVEVSPDIVRLKERLHEILPLEENIKISYAHDTIILSGAVSNTGNLARVLAIADPFGKVSNLMDVGGIQQVMLEVRISEVERTLLRRLGVNFNGVSAGGSQFGVSLLNKLTTLRTTPPLAFPFGSSDISAPGGAAINDNINAVFRFMHNGSTWTGFIDALKEQGLVTVLAEPTLTVVSGQTASFNAGGEVPIPEPVGLGLIAIKYKKFGVGLHFTPTVLNDGKISMQVAPRVSELDFSNAVVQQGFLLPAFKERDVSTVVELADGQSFAIAGLLNQTTNDVVSKFPILGDIPILGALFRSTAYKKKETELVVIVTPHLVKPLDMSKQTLPTDKFSDPGDFKFYLMGTLSGKPKEEKGHASFDTSGFDGEAGHLVP